MESWFIPQFTEYAKIPNLNPSLDKEYLKNDNLQTAMHQIHQAIADLDLNGVSTRTFYDPQTGIPMIIYVVEPTQQSTKNYMFYGHIDKKPYGEGKDQESNPQVSPKRDFMEGRGTGWDVYSPFAFMLAVKAA